MGELQGSGRHRRAPHRILAADLGSWCLIALVAALGSSVGAQPTNDGTPHRIRSVHGVVDVSALARHSSGLGRSLMQAQGAGHAHHVHPAWGPLAQQATYLLSLGGEASRPEKQEQLLGSLHQQGAVVSALLPPHTWVVTAGPAAAQWMEQLNDTVLAPYPPHLKIAPEWLTLTRKLHLTAVAQQLHAAMQHASTVISKLPQPAMATASEAGTAEAPVKGPADDGPREPWLGTPRMHLRTGRSGHATPAQGSLAEGVGATSNLAGSGAGTSSVAESEAGTSSTSSAPAGASARRLAQRSAASAASAAGPSSDASPTPMFLIDVVFPAFATQDLRRLGLARLAPGTAHAAILGCMAGGVCDAGLGNGTLLPALAAALDWQQPLQAAAPACGAELIVERGRLMVAACEQDLVRVLQWLAEQPSVRWLAPHMQTKLQADDFNVNAAAIVQSGQYAAGTSTAMHAHWAAGINGTGQVVGSGDTGLDMDSCYFWDPAVPFSRSGSYTLASTGETVPAFVDPRHRKVVFYYAYGDYVDNSGHGSHTGCTIAGSQTSPDLLGSPDGPTGMAPLAKLAYIDLSTSQNAQSDVILRPGNMVEDYYPWTYSQGARIHSDSWGSDGSVYDDACKQVDTFVWENDDFLPIFAAGNDDRPSQEPTIRSPALAKNAMAVGATLTLNPSMDPAAITTWKMTISQPLVGGTVPAMTHDALLMASSAAPSWEGLAGGTPKVLAAATPMHGCSGLNPSSVQGRVLVVQRGTCSVDQKLSNAQAAGAVGMIVTNDHEEGFFFITLDGSVTPAIPLGNVPLNTGRWLWGAANTTSVAATVAISERGSLGQPYDTLASFSSFGPSPDGRIKPDIVAPGQLISAGTDNVFTNGGTCASTSARMQGTSMATPVVAGTAALVRHYFTDGYYPSGVRTPANAYPNPSGALVRAVLMAGAAPLQGNIEAASPSAGGFPVEPPPSVRQGWGRVDLSRSLPLPGNTLGWHIQVIDRANLSTGQSHSYCVQSTGGPLRVALVYHDWPGDLLADEKLVNDLGLEVRASAYGGLPMLGNNHNDTHNNVETVLIDNLPAGNVSITVTAFNVFARASPQTYALVVLGAFSGVLQSPNNPVGGGSTTSGSCVILLAVIDDSLSTSAPLLATNDLSFVFGTASGTEAPRGFECSLTNNNGSTSPAPLHDWKACSSPQAYDNVPDGIYQFAVRTTGDSLATRRKITVDTTPPTTQLRDPLGLSAAANGPTPTTATPNITFTMLAQDASPVTFKCELTYDGTDNAHFRSLPPNNVSLNTADGQPCQSPLSFTGLSYGGWKLGVTATDAAGNMAQKQVVSWSQQYKPGIKYARFDPASLPPALINNARLNFTLYAFQGAASGAPTPLDAATTPFEYRAWRTRNPVPTTWTAFSGGRLSVPASPDGEWQVQARVVGTPDTEPLAFAPFTVTVDTQPPVLVIKEKPNAISSQAIATVSWNVSAPDDIVSITFACRWLYSATGAIDLSLPQYSTATVPFTRCNSTTPGMASLAVQNGHWVFQVQGTDLAGNTAAPQTVRFQTDVDPPVITIITNPGSTTNPAINITYTVDDGATGSGLANVTCTMRATNLLDKPSGLMGPAPGLPFRRVNGTQESPCPAPSALYSIKEGQYVFTLVAVDKAGLHTQVELPIVLDLLAPVAKVATPIKPVGVAFPSTFTMSISAVDLPKEGGAAGLNHTDCMMSQVPAASGPSLLTVPNTNGTAGNTSAASGAGRRLQQAPAGPVLVASPGSAPVAVAWDTWLNCGAGTQVTFQQFTSGYYSFKVRPVDNAGNTGNVSDAYVFRVDDSLPLDPNAPLPLNPGSGGGSGSSSTTNALAIGLTVGLGILLVGVILAVIIGLRRKAKARQMAEAAAQPQPQPLWNPHDPHAAAFAARQQQEAQWEQQRVRRAIEASLEEDNLRKALEASRMDAARQADDARLQAAIRASLQQR